MEGISQLTNWGKAGQKSEKENIPYSDKLIIKTSLFTGVRLIYKGGEKNLGFGGPLKEVVKNCPVAYSFASGYTENKILSNVFSIVGIGLFMLDIRENKGDKPFSNYFYAGLGTGVLALILDQLATQNARSSAAFFNSNCVQTEPE